MKYKGVSLFSGCGGLDLGFEKSDLLLSSKKGGSIFEVLWANDIDEEAVNTYAYNFEFEKYTNPELSCNDEDKNIFLGDVRDIDFKNKLEFETDFILGGFPCQDFSILRGKDKRKGIKVKRGKLYLQFVRSLVELQPKFFVAENVKGLKSANGGAAFEQIKDDFQHLKENWPEVSRKIDAGEKAEDIDNYRILFDKVVNFADYGVPQNRERLIIIGVKEGLLNLDAEEELKLKREVERQLLPQDVLPITPIEVLEGRELSRLQDNYKKIMEEYETYLKKMDTERAEEYRESVWNNYTMNIIDDYFDINDLDELEYNKKKRKILKVLKELGVYNKPVENNNYKDKSNKKVNSQERIKARMRRIPPGENHKFVRETEHSVKGLMSNIYRRIHPLAPSPTIIANGGGGTYGYHYKRERQNLTNRERARLQGFPDNFIFKGNKSDKRRQIGNSVPPLGAKKIAEVIKNTIIPQIESDVEYISSEKEVA